LGNWRENRTCQGQIRLLAANENQIHACDSADTPTALAAEPEVLLFCQAATKSGGQLQHGVRGVASGHWRSVHETHADFF
jgi:hypothetical protein